MKSLTIDSKIVGFSVDSEDKAANEFKPDQMHEAVKRHDVLAGATYKLKTPEHVSAHSMYITINDIILNKGTPHEARRPFEVFINSKNMDHFQWIVALTRICSAVFRKGGDTTFLVEELKSVFDPRGGYWNNGKLQNSIVAEIGNVIERHLIEIGMMRDETADAVNEEYAKEKREAYLKANNDTVNEESGYPTTAVNCGKCNEKAVVKLDGCMTCLSCGSSKCS